MITAKRLSFLKKSKLTEFVNLETINLDTENKKWSLLMLELWLQKIFFLSVLFFPIIFNNYAPVWFGNETVLYTAYQVREGKFEIPFMVNMGWSFVFTVLIMVFVSLAGPKVNPKAFEIDESMFRLKPSTIAFITIIVLTIFALYVKFW